MRSSNAGRPPRGNDLQAGRVLTVMEVARGYKILLQDETPPSRPKWFCPRGLKAAAPNKKQLTMLKEDDLTASGGTNSVVNGQPLLGDRPVPQ